MLCYVMYTRNDYFIMDDSMPFYRQFHCWMLNNIVTFVVSQMLCDHMPHYCMLYTRSDSFFMNDSVVYCA